MKIKLCVTHSGTKVHKTNKFERPCCDNRKKGIFQDYVSIHVYEGEESEITCTKCLNKIKKYRKKII